MALADDDQGPLELIGLYEDQTEEVVWARRVGWANEGLTPDDEAEWTDTREGSFFHVATIGGVREDARIYDLMGTEVVAAAHPLFAWGGYLDSHAEVQKLLRNAAVRAEGEVTFFGTDGTVIPLAQPVGTEPTDPDAEAPTYEVTLSRAIGADTPGEVTVPVRSIAGGKLGDVAPGAITAILADLPGVDSVTNAAAIVGGADTETDEELRARLLAVFGGGGGWNQAHFKIAALAYGNGIGRVTVLPLWDGPGTVKVVVATADGDPVAPGTVTGLQAFLDPIAAQGAGEVMVGITTTVATVTLVNVTFAATVEFETGYSLDGDGGTVATRDLIEVRLRDYIEAVESGDEIVLAKARGLIAPGVRGVHDIGGATLNGVAANLALSGGATPEAATLLAVDLVEGDV